MQATKPVQSTVQDPCLLLKEEENYCICFEDTMRLVPHISLSIPHIHHCLPLFFCLNKMKICTLMFCLCLWFLVLSNENHSHSLLEIKHKSVKEKLTCSGTLYANHFVFTEPFQKLQCIYIYICILSFCVLCYDARFVTQSQRIASPVENTKRHFNWGMSMQSSLGNGECEMGTTLNLK